MINRKLIVVVICFIISFFSFWPAKAQNIPAPIIDNAQFNEIAKVWIINGTTAEDTEVMLFLDSKFIGLALIKNNGNKKIFCYSLGKSLTIGKHNFTALARDKNSYLTSVYSQQFSIDIEPDQKSKTAVVRTGDTLVAPIIITPLTILVFGQNKPLIIGLANVGDMVEVYFDGRLDGETAKLVGATGIASFAYLPSQELAIGEHTLYVKAINQQGQDNGQSDGISFSVEQKLPAPILNELLIKNSAGQLVLTGLVKNNLIVNIYLDEKKIDTFRAENNTSGTSNFAYIFHQDLTDGGHLIYATALDTHGKERGRSNYVYYLAATGSLTPSITPEIAAGTKGENETGTGSPLVLGEDSTLKLREQELNKILKPEKTTKNENSGLINESKEQQGKLKWNLLIFILFLIALVVWVFWVNKELIKEKKAQAKKEEQQDDNIQDKLI